MAVPDPAERSDTERGWDPGRKKSGADLGTLLTAHADRRSGRISLPGSGGVGAGGRREGGDNDGEDKQATADHDENLCDSCDWRCNWVRR